ncbi:MAG: DEAD/DEAH box helicase [Candidatus Micrarchaeota archaeon]|nr:DEAD/DEAH box helicase [Candidatus Micrarchaeota archaeon]
MKKFSEMNIKNEIAEMLEKYELTTPTEIQTKAIPLIREGKDIIGQSETGSGKTLAFGIPILENIEPGKGIQALIVTPTRELANQIKDEFIKFGRNTKMQVISVYGGVSIEPQINGLRTATIVVGTPGRILDHLNRGTMFLKNVKFLVLDEADRMLDMGFIDDVNTIIQNTPTERQTLLFSATMPYEIQEISKRYMKNPVTITTRPQVKPEKLKQIYYNCSKNEKFSLLFHLLNKEKERGMTMVFCGRRRTADMVADNLRRNGIKAEEMHGGLSQSKRESLLSDFHKRKFDVLVATDVASRGLDIKGVTHVFNYDIPDKTDDYTHRIGRTARAGNEGIAISLLSPEDFDNFRKVLAPEIKVENGGNESFKKIPFRTGSSFGQRNGFGRGRSPSGNWGNDKRRNGRKSFRRRY